MDPAARLAGHSARHRSLCRILLAVMLLACSVARAEAAALTGRVVDPDGRTVAGARVQVAGALGVRTVFTDADGRFELLNLPPGTYRVLVETAGLYGSSAPITLQAESALTIDIELGLTHVSEWLVVSAAHVETPLGSLPGSVSVVSAPELRSRQVENLGDALRLVPGLAVSRSGGRGAITSVFPRGGESDFTLVLVDGVRLNAFGGGFDLAQAAIGNVERIEAVRGPQSALYGSDAIGGVVQIVTAHGGPIRGDALLEAGSFGTSRISATTAGGARRITWNGSVERGASDGFRGAAPASGETVANDDSWQRQFQGSIGWDAAAGITIRAGGRAFDSERGFPGPYGSDPLGAFPGVDLVSRGRTHDRHGIVSVTAPWGRLLDGRVRQRTSVAYGDLDSDFSSPFGPSAFETRRLSVRAQTDVALTAASSVSAGVEVQGERARSTFITGESFQEVPISRLVAGYFGEWRQQVGARLALTAGLRVEQIRRSALEGNPSPFTPRPSFAADTVVSPNPRLSIVYTARTDAAGSARTRLFASAGTGIRPPDAFEIAFTDNPSLAPERSRSFDAGVSQTVPGGGTAQLTAFRNDHDDLIVAVSRSLQDASRYRTDNISNARAQGLEASTTWRSGWGLSARASYTWLHTEILAVDRSASAPPPFTVGDPLLRRPRHQASLDLAVVRRRFTVFVEAGGRGRALDVEPNLGAFGGLFYTPAFAVVHAGAAVRPHRSVEVFARGLNLFDRSYEETLGFPALGRSGMMGVRVALSR